MNLLISFIFMLLLFTNSAFACKAGETWFDWKTLQRVRCDEQIPSENKLPWQKDGEVCTWINLPDNQETKGRDVCRNSNLGRCKAVVRDNILKPSGNFIGMQYDCSETLFFKPSKKECTKSILEGFPDECTLFKGRASCCQ